MVYGLLVFRVVFVFFEVVVFVDLGDGELGIVFIEHPVRHMHNKRAHNERRKATFEKKVLKTI